MNPSVRVKAASHVVRSSAAAGQPSVQMFCVTRTRAFDCSHTSTDTRWYCQPSTSTTGSLRARTNRQQSISVASAAAIAEGGQRRASRMVRTPPAARYRPVRAARVRTARITAAASHANASPVKCERGQVAQDEAGERHQRVDDAPSDQGYREEVGESPAWGQDRRSGDGTHENGKARDGQDDHRICVPSPLSRSGPERRSWPCSSRRRDPDLSPRYRSRATETRRSVALSQQAGDPLAPTHASRDRAHEHEGERGRGKEQAVERGEPAATRPMELHARAVAGSVASTADRFRPRAADRRIGQALPFVRGLPTHRHPDRPAQGRHRHAGLQRGAHPRADVCRHPT